MNLPYQTGDTAFVAEASAFTQTSIPCPICFGKLSVTLILGNGESQTVECEACGKGCYGPTGTASVYKATSSVRRITITGVMEDGWEDRWIVSEGHSTYRLSDGNVFPAEAEAEARRAVLMAEAEKQAERNMESNMRGHKKQMTWSANYHRQEIARRKREIEWHEARLAMKK